MSVVQIFSSQCTAVFISHGGRQEAQPPTYINLAQVCWARTVMPQNLISLSMSNGSTWELQYQDYPVFLKLVQAVSEFNSNEGEA
ncbi:hypothetical protein [uncultured Roseobacter sp.]|uniref:hypothetical protein n=1 Tax=uncultured Roseobacter sp. TaxID=114847 RepID=UPI00261F91BE|nr:hypothetical protein [uncultured Roseobacter sp.]